MEELNIKEIIRRKEEKRILTGTISGIEDEYDKLSNIAIASRIEAMQLRSQIELPKLKVNDVIVVRVISVGVKQIIVGMYGKEISIKADNLKHTYITNCKDLYKNGEQLKVRIKSLYMDI